LPTNFTKKPSQRFPSCFGVSKLLCRHMYVCACYLYNPDPSQLFQANMGLAYWKLVLLVTSTIEYSRLAISRIFTYTHVYRRFYLSDRTTVDCTCLPYPRL
jgi:hypothetical protein